MAKAVALVHLRDMLQGAPLRSNEIAERLGVSSRTAQRYVRDLEGAPLYTPLCAEERGREIYYRVMANSYATPAEFLARGLKLEPLLQKPEPIPGGAVCAITGAPISEGYRVADMVTDATNEFLDCFRGGIHGWVSDAAARCFKNSSPRAGNPTARAVMVFEDGEYFNPLISRESAQEQGRPCWSGLVREVWPSRRGLRVLIILTTDMKRRLWIRARVGVLGEQTPVFCYDAATAHNETLWCDWPTLLECLDCLEAVYSLGFSKAALRGGLYANHQVAQRVGLRETATWERALTRWRRKEEFEVAALIAQRREDDDRISDGDE